MPYKTFYNTTFCIATEKSSVLTKGNLPNCNNIGDLYALVYVLFNIHRKVITYGEFVTKKGKEVKKWVNSFTTLQQGTLT